MLFSVCFDYMFLFVHKFEFVYTQDTAAVDFLDCSADFKIHPFVHAVILAVH